jgi:predicted ATPase
MITQMRVQNFKALRDVTVDLEPFTVLIGPNDSGKSSFLEAVYAISESPRMRLDQCFWSSWTNRELVYNQYQDGLVNFQVRFEEQNAIHYSVFLRFPGARSCQIIREFINDEEIGIRDPRNSQLCEFHYHPTSIPIPLASNVRYLLRQLNSPTLARWNLEDLASPSRLPPERRLPIDPSGYGLATCIAEMKLDEIDRYQQLVESFLRIFPTYRDFRIKRVNINSIERDDQFRKVISNNGEGFALFLVREDGVEIPASLASGGTLITLAFLTLTHLREPRKLLLIEEPENGLHPSRLGEIIEVLQKAVQSQPDSQVILTTHSPLLLNYVDPKEVRVFLRNKEKDNDVEVFNLAQVPDIKDRIKYMMLGDLVYNEGEEGLVKEIKSELIKETEHAHSDSGGGAD